jgi:Ser/Thr protein kinase RdoA (MazF antagonist)
LLDEGSIPLRVTHNDTKCNNVSFDKDTGEALAVLDLDTVMPGAIAHDFGDAIRFVANTLIEDDPDYESVKLDIDKYRAFAKGFIGEVGESLTELEKSTLNLGVFTMTVELAVRFLTDYVNGDVYFKTKYPGHNLERARNQIALAKDIIKKREVMDDILKKYV